MPDLDEEIIFNGYSLSDSLIFIMYIFIYKFIILFNII